MVLEKTRLFFILLQKTTKKHVKMVNFRSNLA